MNTPTLYHNRTWLLMLLLSVAATVALSAWLVCAGGNDLAEDSPPVDSLLRVDLPADAVDVVRLDYRGFTAYYDPHWRQPRCVVYVLTAERTAGDVAREKHFRADTAVIGCAVPTDYARSGWQRGHLAPAVHMKWDSLAMRQSFLMTNVCPQHPRLNAKAWQLLEQKCSEWAVRFDTIVVATGPVPGAWADTIRPANVLVPNAFFKVVLAPCAHPPQCIAFLYANGPNSTDLNRHVAGVRQVERLTGLNFFAAYDPARQDSIETAPPMLNAWLR